VDLISMPTSLRLWSHDNYGVHGKIYFIRTQSESKLDSVSSILQRLVSGQQVSHQNSNVPQNPWKK